MDKQILCQKCTHYYVTWEVNTPHGCKIYGFKSKNLPSKVVKNSSGSECKFFILKNVKK